jgi:hypothetical protein
MAITAPDNGIGHFIRTRDFENTYKLFSEYDGTVFSDDHFTTTRITDEWSKSDTVHHKFRTTHGIPWRDPTEYSRKVSKYLYEGGFLHRVYDPNPEWVRENFGGVWLGGNPRDFNPEGVVAEHLGLLPTDGAAQAVTECLLKLNEGKVHLGQYLAESKNSAEMIASLGTDLCQLLLKAKHGQWSSIPKEFGLALRKGRDYYLAWNFGWKPLASDIYNLYQGLIHKPSVAPFLHASRSVKTNFDYETTYNGDKVDVKVKHTDRCKLYAGLSEEMLAGLQSYDLINPVSLAWELVPYSFVVDWFAPIGNTLSTLTATAGLEFIGGYSSQTREGTITIHGSLAGSVKKEFFFFHRHPHDSFPSGGFYGRQNPLSLDKAAKLLALLSQLF